MSQALTNDEGARHLRRRSRKFRAGICNSFFMRRSIIEEISSRTFRWIKYDTLIFDFSCLLIVIGISFKILEGYLLLEKMMEKAICEIKRVSPPEISFSLTAEGANLLVLL